ncbi:hypothetical protein [Ornithinibacillus contaminans]|uniref:hypothetical protein n=1 Tax=Ornithinibacillus contaminans TaxID=694055 RepID=UPI00064DA0EB|nr:hypothetical protein [Ornithinibacillus contaminans]
MKNEKELSLAEKNRLLTAEKVKKALELLKKSNKPINISSVSKMAKVSRKTLSTNRPDLKAMIEEASSLQRDLRDSEGVISKPKGTTQSDRLKQIREKNKKLILDKKKTLEQNMILTKENMQLKERLADLEEKLYSQAELKVVEMKEK